jgi:hypothetical protein
MTATLEDLLGEVGSMNVIMDFPELLPADRCDRCSAQAFVITLHLAGHLYWCKHHYEEHLAKLVSDADHPTRALAVHDKRDTINKAASISASN